MGEWRTGTPFVVTGLIRRYCPLMSYSEARHVAQGLLDIGLLVDARYYVPDAEELLDAHGQLGRIVYYTSAILDLRIGWVMCMETQLALYERHHGDIAAVNPLAVPWEQDSESRPPMLFEPGQVRIISQAPTLEGLPQGYLFGLPIRTDPAARRPMFELLERKGKTDAH